MRKNTFFNNWIVKNLLFAVIFVAVIVIATNITLSLITQHSKEIFVPDFSNMTITQAHATAQSAGVRADVIDSVYVRRMQRGAVFSQNPTAGSKVKKGRRILLTINAVVPQKVTMPSLVGFSMRQAKAELSSRGLMLGRLIYVSDMATNNVLKQLYHNREVAPGTTIESGAQIDLVVGLNYEDSRTYVPNVVGMKYMSAVDAVHDNSLNISSLVFDNSVVNYNDSLNAIVYKQSPADTETPLTMGAGVKLYLK